MDDFTSKKRRISDGLVSTRVKDTLSGQVIAYCEQVQAGAKLCGQLLCSNDYVPFVREVISRERCRSIHRSVSRDVTSVFIYKYKFVELLIDELCIKKDQRNPGVVDIWAAGKLFGYSDLEILNYLRKHGYLDRSD